MMSRLVLVGAVSTGAARRRMGNLVELRALFGGCTSGFSSGFSGFRRRWRRVVRWLELLGSERITSAFEVNFVMLVVFEEQTMACVFFVFNE